LDAREAVAVGRIIPLQGTNGPLYISAMGAFLAGNIPEDCHPKVRALTEYWLSIHPERGLPGRQNFEPCDIPTLLPSIYLVDVRPLSGNLTFRLMGTGLVKLFARDHTGQPFESAYDSGQRSNSYRDIREMIADKQPRWRKAPGYFMKDRDHLTLERVVLPLAADGATVNIVLGMILAHTAGGDLV
jgi:hypothetical protein